MRRLLIGLVLVAAAEAGAQTRTDVHPGKVQIRSTASDALSILGGASLSGSLAITGSGGATITNTLPLFNLRETDQAIDEKFWRVWASDKVFYISAETDAGAPDTAIAITRSGGTVSQVLLKNGSTGTPALSFISDTDTGLSANGTAMRVSVGGIETGLFETVGFTVASRARGSGIAGPYMLIGRNSSGTGAPGAMYLTDGADNLRSIWVDTTGVVRVGGATIPVEGGSDTIGTVVGTQTSSLASKDLLYQITSTSLAMDVIRRTPVFAFTYKNGAYNGERFYGIVTDYSPIFGMDGGKSFNPVTAFGATVLALQDLDARVRALEAQR
jgi:hypothetical protein